jgi:uncharacterized protein YfdQ (DUF2303 family)
MSTSMQYPRESIAKATEEQFCNAMGFTTALTALAGAAMQPVHVDGHHFVMVPKDVKREDITDAVEKAHLAPFRKRGAVALKDLASFTQYCNEQASSLTGYIYADPDTRTFTAVFNDHRDAVVGGWRDHRATYKAEFTPEFQKWMGNDKQHKNQVAFAEFIEDNFVDIAGNDAQLMLDVATTIQAKTDITFSSSKRLENGQAQLTYNEVINAQAGANGALTIPKTFGLGLRLFKNGAGYLLKARLKYRLQQGGVTFWYELDRPEKAIEDAFAGYIQQVRDTAGGYTVLLGTP